MKNARFDFLVENMSEEIYSRFGLYDIIYRYYPAYTPSSCDWVIGILKERGLIYPLGNGFYKKSKKIWCAPLSEPSQRIINKLLQDFPFSTFAATETDFVNQCVGREVVSCLIIEISKKDLFPCYMRLRELTKKDVMLAPSERELSFYLKPGTIIIKPLFSKSPCRKDGGLTIEKLIVDLLSDRTLGFLYGETDQNSLVALAREFNVNLITCMNYAKRRRCKKKAATVLRKAVPMEYDEIIVEDVDDD